MDRLLECVPNFSEGRNSEIIKKIAFAIQKMQGVNLLHVDSGFSVNRTVMTFIGHPEAVIDAAYEAIKVAAEWIDMSVQEGTHPRIGATDVCPLVPLKGLTLEEASEYALALSQRVGKFLGIPVYLYEYSSKYDYRKKLADIRRGGYEHFEQKMNLPEWKPDYGPDTFNQRTGATVIGVRKILIAFNINLNTADQKIASKIASRIREGGENGMQGVRAIGWFIPEYNAAQVSLNITDYLQCPIHLVFEECKKLAYQIGVEITGSELIGMIPQRALLEAGEYYAQNEKNESRTLIDLAKEKLGLKISLQERVLTF
jgi:glutamate formiminotransferase